MDKLERYIKKNREGFDTEDPRDDLWTKISDGLQKSEVKKQGFSGIKIWRAAAVVLLLTTSWLVFDKIYKDDTQAPSNGENGYLSEFREVEKFYMSAVAEKKMMLKKAAADDPEYRKEFFEELEDLDNQYKGLKENLKYGNTEDVINALIINLQLRIEILNKQLEIIKELNKTEDENFI